MSKSNAIKNVETTTPKANAVPKPTKPGKGKGKGRAAAGTVVGTVVKTSSEANRMTVFNGVSACKILKWMGMNGWSRKDATKVATHIWPNISGSTIGCQFYSGRARAAGNEPTHSGSAADLTKEQVGELEALKVKLESK